MHTFFDLSTIERLLPLLRSIAPVNSLSSFNKAATLDELPTPRTATLDLPTERTSHFVLGDLDAQVSSLSTLRMNHHASELVIVRCPMVRLDIRCPALLNRKGSWVDGGYLRSGIVTLDIHGLVARNGQFKSTVPPTNPLRTTGDRSRPRIGAEADDNASVEWQKMILFFCRVPGKPLHSSRKLK